MTELDLTLKQAPTERDMALTILRNAAKDSGHGGLHDAAQSPEWNPGEWLIDAIMAGMEQGRDVAAREQEARNLTVQEGMDEHYREAQTSIIRATLAAAMAAPFDGGYVQYDKDEDGRMRSVKFTINMESLRTVWDRYELLSSRNEAQTVVNYVLQRKTD